MTKLTLLRLSILTLLICVPLWGKVKLVTSTTDIAWAATAIGGSRVEVSSLLKGTEDPHYVDAVPRFIHQVANADVVCVVGLDLEIGWIPKVLSKSGNSGIQPNAKGYCDLGNRIDPIEKPTTPVDRSMGHVHPAGNPHFWLNPNVFAQAAAEIRDALSRVDPEGLSVYAQNYEAFKKRMAALVERNKAKLPRDLKVIEYHQEFGYLIKAYGMVSMGAIEANPGVRPSAGRLAEVAIRAKTTGVRLALAASTAPKPILKKFEELSQVPVIQLPLSIYPGQQDYEKLQEEIISTIVKATPQRPQTS